MSKTEVLVSINRRYLMRRSKEQLATMILELLDEINILQNQNSKPLAKP